jgi:hypothetical protein
VVNECVLDEPYRLPSASLHDVMMFVVLGAGGDRTERGYAGLFAQAGAGVLAHHADAVRHVLHRGEDGVGGWGGVLR